MTPRKSLEASEETTLPRQTRLQPESVAYLAYGSNMFTAQLIDRVPSARNPRVVELPGYVVRYRKESIDRSAKCDLVLVGGSARAYGVIFEIDSNELGKLDEAEGEGQGYRRDQLTVVVDALELQALVYLADRFVDDSVSPYDWYRDIVVAGAREHGLPSSYVAEQLNVPARPDPNEGRSGRRRAFLRETGAQS
jgi:gamma-glutamylcyclotransferase